MARIIQVVVDEGLFKWLQSQDRNGFATEAAKKILERHMMYEQHRDA